LTSCAPRKSTDARFAWICIPKDLRAIGESEQWIYLLDAWRETSFYTPRERAALTWTEALTRVSETHVPDDVYEETAAHFNAAELAYLTYAVAQIDAWNRIAVAARSEPGNYQSRLGTRTASVLHS
jgi:alkylhydroperoxidase family enzyme